MASTPPTGQRPSYDLTLTRLLTRAHDGFRALIAPDLTWRGERSPELPAVARQADLVWEVASPAGVPGIPHIELQTHPDDEMGERLAEYAIRLWRPTTCRYARRSSSCVPLPSRRGHRT